MFLELSSRFRLRRRISNFYSFRTVLPILFHHRAQHVLAYWSLYALATTLFPSRKKPFSGAA